MSFIAITVRENAYRMRADEAGLESFDLGDVVGAGLERFAADPVVEA